MIKWNEWIKEQWGKEPLKTILGKVQAVRKKTFIYPEHKDLLTAFNLTPYDKIKVVILGQDPYPQPGIAHGLAFSTKQISTPSSLAVILKEISTDIYNIKDAEKYAQTFKSNDLSNWARQGVFLLNTALTVEKYIPGSHTKLWQPFILEVIKLLNEIDRPVVWMLWGSYAKQFEKFIANGSSNTDNNIQGFGDLFNRSKKRHLILTADHPASDGIGGSFSGCKHFSKCNNFLEEHYGKGQGIDWQTYPNGEDGFPPEWQNYDWIAYGAPEVKELKRTRGYV